MPEKFRPIKECFERSTTIRAQHLLWEDLQQERTDIRGRQTYKMAFYLWLERNELGAELGKDKNGDFGYGLKFIPNLVDQ